MSDITSDTANDIDINTNTDEEDCEPNSDEEGGMTSLTQTTTNDKIIECIRNKMIYSHLWYGFGKFMQFLSSLRKNHSNPLHIANLRLKYRLLRPPHSKSKPLIERMHLEVMALRGLGEESTCWVMVAKQKVTIIWLHMKSFIQIKWALLLAEARKRQWGRLLCSLSAAHDMSCERDNGRPRWSNCPARWPVRRSTAGTGWPLHLQLGRCWRHSCRGMHTHRVLPFIRY